MTLYTEVERHHLNLNQRQEETIAQPVHNQLVYLSENLQSHNQLYNSAAGLLALCAELKTNRLECNVINLKAFLVEELNNFGLRATQLGIDKIHTDATRYLLCAVLDEFILNQQLDQEYHWQSDEDWSKQSLVNIFYYDLWGGEKFFEILDHMLEDAEANIQLIEVISICLSLGYEGKFRMMELGKERLNLLRNKILLVLQQHYPDYKLSLINISEPRPKKVKTNYAITWFICFSIIAVMLCCFLYSYFNQELQQQASPTYSLIHDLSQGN